MDFSDDFGFTESPSKPENQSTRTRKLLTSRLRDEPHAKKMKDALLKDVMEKDKVRHLQAADLSSARAEICVLKERSSSLQLQIQQARVTHDHELLAKDAQIQGSKREIEELKRKQTEFETRHRQLQESLSATRLQLDASKQQLHREKMSAAMERAEFLSESDKKLNQSRAAEMKAEKKAIDLQSELTAARAERDLMEKQNKHLEERSDQLLDELKQLQSQYKEMLDTKVKCQELERKLSATETEQVISRSVTSQLRELEQLRRDHEQLTSQHTILRNERENVLLLKEKNSELEKRVEQLQHCSTQLSTVQAQYDALKEKLSDWEVLTTSHGLSLSPVEAVRQLSSLQSNNALLMEQNGRLTTSSKELRKRVSSLQQELESATSELASTQALLEQNETHITQTQRTLQLIQKDNELMKTIWDQDMSLVTDSDMTKYIDLSRSVREATTASDQQLGQLGDRLRRVTDEKTQVERRCRILQRQLEQVKTSISEEVETNKITSALREQLADAEKLLQAEREKVARLEGEATLRYMQGDYDRSKSKVVHLADNPTTQKVQERQRLVAELQQERRELRDQLATARERIAVLEEGVEEEVTMVVERRLEEKDEVDPQEIKELKQKLRSSELRLVRYMEVTDRQCQLLRKAFTELMGYKFTVTRENGVDIFRLHSVYGSAEDVLLFRYSKTDGIQMMTTNYVQDLTELTQVYLEQKESIPGLMSAITLKLLNSAAT